jgi:uncharacterized protein
MSATPLQVPVTPGVWEDAPDGPHLIGSRCIDCNTFAFPEQRGCQRCTGTNTERAQLSNKGVLWTFTVQGFPPKSPPFRGDADPKTFVPFGVGYVELPGQVKVEARLTESDPAKLRIGMELEMIVEKIATDANGNDVVTFAFRPTGN